MRYPIVVSEGYIWDGVVVITAASVVGHVIYAPCPRPPRRERRRARKRRTKA